MHSCLCAPTQLGCLQDSELPRDAIEMAVTQAVEAAEELAEATGEPAVAQATVEIPATSGHY